LDYSFCVSVADLLISLSHPLSHLLSLSSFFFFHDTATTEIYTLSLHDALPICNTDSLTISGIQVRATNGGALPSAGDILRTSAKDRKSTRLNSSHVAISYAVFCLKKKKKPSNCPKLTTLTYTGLQTHRTARDIS